MLLILDNKAINIILGVHKNQRLPIDNHKAVYYNVIVAHKKE